MKVLFINTGDAYDISSSIEKFKLDDVLDKKSILSSRSEDNSSVKKGSVVSEIEQLQSKVLNSLNYAESQNVLPSTLPEQLNVKFLNTSTLDKLIDRIMPSPIAQLEDSNTMYISTNLLPQNQLKSRNNLISKLYDKFKNPQQVLDLVVFHEIGHLVFNNSFNQFANFNNELLNTRNGVERFKIWFKEDFKDLPLYQMNRSLEEHFADSYSSIILSKRYNSNSQDYIDIRNGNDSLGVNRTKGFDININRLDNNEFNKLSSINYEKVGIDVVIKQLYEVALAGSKEVMSNQLKLVRNDNFLDKLQSNLNSLGVDTKSDKKDILDKAEDLIKSKAGSSEIKGISNKRMFSMPNVEERLIFFENKFSQADSMIDSSRLRSNIYI